MLQKREDPEDWASIKTLQSEIEHLLEMEDLQWRQQAKRNWFWGGDRNTHYFHTWANHRRKVNTIAQIQDDQGRDWSQPNDLCCIFVQYFQGIFFTATPVGVYESLANITPRVTKSMNSLLLRDFTSEDVHFALSQMHPLKSPGQDGFLAGFYQTHWTVVGPNVSTAVLSFLNTGVMDATLNSTHLALIPMVTPARKASDFCPISLCNVLYKLIAKVLANRLK